MQNPTSPRRLPPMNAVRAFEAAARHSSFTRAADELFVTPGAVSHQVRLLEDWFGFPLFDRYKREVHLTEKGSRYLPFIRGMLNDLGIVTSALMNEGSERLLCVSAPESLATNWLLDRLVKFNVEHPEYDVRLTSQNQIDDLGNIVGKEGQQWVDLRIRYGLGKWPDLEVTKLFDEEIFPVCHPRLLSGPNPLNSLEDLNHHTLIQDDMQVPWEAWLQSIGMPEIKGLKGPRFSHSHMALEAAVLGHGVVLGRNILAHDYLKSGGLVRPFDISIPAEHSYYLLCQDHNKTSPKIMAFKLWLLQEIKILN